MIRTAFLVLISLFAAMSAASIFAAEPAAAGLPNPFFAMDTAMREPGLTREQQLDLVKELGYAGVTWTEPPLTLSEQEALDKVNSDVAESEKRGLKMFAIYCTARVTRDGDLTYSKRLPAIMELLKGHGTIIWLHIGGKGPAFDAAAKQPAIEKLRELADLAQANQLKIAFYPHIGEWIDHFGDAVKLARAVDRPNFGVTFNLCHCLAVGDEDKIPALLEQAKDVLQVVTICGADSGVTGSKWNQLIQTLDKGTFDTQIVLKTLQRIGFTGPIGFQGYGIKSDARSILTPTIAAWRKLSAETASK